MMAAGVLAAATEARIAVPATLAVAGFDDMPIAARLSPALTSVHIPWRTMAHDAVRRLFASHLTPEPMIYPAPILERPSTAMPTPDLSRSALDPGRV
ncbi:substrate-binding domain-containing protein [Novosphingobium sp. 9]|uniref:substrate-binding domain-containing protein n=1 Tax=Novosphingobium sp. 9 TaxID=2025349 RepID=UPI0021B66949|nr:substrate-binding domain-containing protein [Novosphingobium sp. 9]